MRRTTLIAILGTAAVLGLSACGSSSPGSGSGSTTTAGSQSGGGALSAAQQAADQAAVAGGCKADPSTTLTKPHWSSPPAMSVDASKTYTATVKTDAGSFVITLDASKTPKTVNNFVFLAQNHFYDCIIFHRVIPGFMNQTGDPTGTGTGGPGYAFADELPKTANPQYPLGSVAMANSGPNTNGSPFFIVTGSEGESLAPNYSLFGQVTSGMDVVQKINADGNADASADGVPPKVIHRILSISIASS